MFFRNLKIFFLGGEGGKGGMGGWGDKKSFSISGISMKQFGIKSGPTFCWAYSETNLLEKAISRHQK